MVPGHRPIDLPVTWCRSFDVVRYVVLGLQVLTHPHLVFPGGSFWHHDVTDINVRLAFDRRIERFLRIPAGAETP